MVEQDRKVTKRMVNEVEKVKRKNKSSEVSSEDSDVDQKPSKPQIKKRLYVDKKKKGKGERIKVYHTEEYASSKPRKRKLKVMKKVKGETDSKSTTESEEEVRVKKKKKKASRPPVIVSRSSLLQLYKCVTMLKDKQKEAVKEMGFGKLLSFRMKEIAATMAHYVIDKFDTKKMDIVLPNGKIIVDTDTMHKLTGIPRSGVNLLSSKMLDEVHPDVKRWRKRYPKVAVAPTSLVHNISIADDEDTFEFGLDFLMLVLAMMGPATTRVVAPKQF